MSNRTDGIRLLVRQVLTIIKSPYSEDVTEDVFVMIDKDQGLIDAYEIEASLPGKATANQAIGRNVMVTTGGVAIREVQTTRTKRAGSYSKLRFPK